jgi:ADP-ribose pyrophosphatase YjhB (NUDIX family)
LYPTGWADIGYSPAEVAVKEVHEETGIEAEPIRIVGVLDGQRFGSRGLPFYSVVFHLRACGGELRPHPLEARDVGWFAEDALPEPLAGGARWRSMAFSAIRGEPADVAFDAPRADVWRGDLPET